MLIFAVVVAAADVAALCLFIALRSMHDFGTASTLRTFESLFVEQFKQMYVELTISGTFSAKQLYVSNARSEI